MVDVMDPFEELIRKFTRDVLKIMLSLPVSELAKAPRAYDEALEAEDRKARPRASKARSPKMRRDPEACRLANRYGYLLRALAPSVAAQMKKIRINSDVRSAVAFGDKRLGAPVKSKPKPTSTKKSGGKVVPEYRRLQGRYLGLLRNAPEKIRKQAKKIANTKGSPEAVKFLEKHRS